MGPENCPQIGGPSASSSANRPNVLRRGPEVRLAQDIDRPFDSLPAASTALPEIKPKISVPSQEDIDKTAYYEGIPVEDYRIIAKILQDITKSIDIRTYKTQKDLSAFITGEMLKRLEAYPKIKEVYQRHLAKPDMPKLVGEKRIQLFNYVLSAMSKEERTSLINPVHDAIEKGLDDRLKNYIERPDLGIQERNFIDSLKSKLVELTGETDKDKAFIEAYDLFKKSGKGSLIDGKEKETFDKIKANLSDEQKKWLLALLEALMGTVLNSVDVQKAYFNMEQIVYKMPAYKDTLSELFSKDKLFAEIYTAQDTFRTLEMAKVSGKDIVISSFIFSYTDEKDMPSIFDRIGFDNRFTEKEKVMAFAYKSGLKESEAACLLYGLQGILASRVWVVSLDEKSTIEIFLVEKPEALAAYKKHCENTRPIPELGRQTKMRVLNSQMRILQDLPDSPAKQKALQYCRKSIADIAKVPDKDVGMSLVQAAYVELNQLRVETRQMLLKTDQRYAAMVHSYSDAKDVLVKNTFCECLKDSHFKEVIGASEWDAEKMRGLSSSDFNSAIDEKFKSQNLTKEQKQKLESLISLCNEAASSVSQLKALEIDINTYELAARNKAYGKLRDDISRTPYGKDLLGICDLMIDLELKDLQRFQEYFERLDDDNEKILT